MKAKERTTVVPAAWTLPIGLHVDALDLVDVWTPAKVKKVRHDGSMLIEYDGWERTWDEWIAPSSNRITPLGTCTRVLKCWVKHKGKLWPALMNVRKSGGRQGTLHLRDESRVLVDLLNAEKTTKRTRFWAPLIDVVSYAQGNVPDDSNLALGKIYEEALRRVRISQAEEITLEFQDGTLPKNDSVFTVQNVEEMKNQIGLEKWEEVCRVKSKLYETIYCIQAESNSKKILKRKRTASTSTEPVEEEIIITKKDTELKTTEIVVTRASHRQTHDKLTAPQEQSAQDHKEVFPESPKHDAPHVMSQEPTIRSSPRIRANRIANLLNSTSTLTTWSVSGWMTEKLRDEVEGEAQLLQG